MREQEMATLVHRSESIDTSRVSTNTMVKFFFLVSVLLQVIQPKEMRQCM